MECVTVMKPSPDRCQKFPGPVQLSCDFLRVPLPLSYHSEHCTQLNSLHGFNLPRSRRVPERLAYGCSRGYHCGACRGVKASWQIKIRSQRYHRKTPAMHKLGKPAPLPCADRMALAFATYKSVRKAPPSHRPAVNGDTYLKTVDSCPHDSMGYGRMMIDGGPSILEDMSSVVRTPTVSVGMLSALIRSFG